MFMLVVNFFVLLELNRRFVSYHIAIQRSCPYSFATYRPKKVIVFTNFCILSICLLVLPVSVCLF